MHLPHVPYNLTVSTILQSFSEDKRDKQTDNLPMMESIAWPIGGQIEKVLFHVGLCFMDALFQLLELLTFL